MTFNRDQNKVKQIKSLINGFSIAIGARVIGVILGFLVTTYIVREFGAATFGNYTIFVSLAIVLATLSRRGWDILLLKLSSQERVKFIKLNNIISITIFESFKTLFFIYFIFLILYFTPLLNFFNEFLIFRNLLQVFLVAPLLIISAITIEFMRGINKLIVSEFIKTILPALSLLIFLMLIGFFYSEVNVINIYLLSSLASALVALFFLLKYSKPSYHLIDKKNFIDLNKIKDRVSFERIVFSNLLSSYFAIIALGLFGTLEEVGFFALALRIISLFNIPLIATDVKLAPLISKNSEDIKTTKSILKFSTFSLAIIVIISLIFTLLSIRYVPIFFGSEFINSVPLILIMFIGLFFQAVFLPFGNFLRMGGFAEINARVSIFSTITSSLVGAFLILEYGALGAALTYCINHILAGIGNIYFYRNLSIH